MPLLPTTKTAPKNTLADLTVLVYGQTKIGKTTLCSQADGALFLATEPGRRRALRAALRLAEGTPLAPDAHEQELLARFVRGEVTLDQLEHRMEAHRRDNSLDEARGWESRGNTAEPSC